MRRVALSACSILLLSTLTALGLAAPAQAADVSSSNSTFVSVDASEADVPVVFEAADFPAGEEVSEVEVTVDFEKDCGARDGFPYNNEIGYRLTSPGGTEVLLAGAGRWFAFEGDGGRVQVTFDDDADTAPGPVPETGTFLPQEPLSTVVGESPAGTWTVNVSDNAGADPLCHYGVSIRLLTDQPAPVLAPDATATPSSVDFGSVVVGSAPTTREVTIGNDGSGDLALSDFTFDPAGGAFSRNGGTCTTATVLAPAESCTVGVSFDPATEGTKNGQLSVASNDPDSPLAIPLSGTATARPVPAATVSPENLDFGRVVVGSTPSTKTVTVTSTGSGTLLVSDRSIVGDDAFTITGGTCENPAVLSRGESCTIEVSLDPSSTGSKTAQLKVLTNEPDGSVTVPLSATVGAAAPADSPSASASPSSVAFGSVTQGTAPATKTVSVTNNGEGDLSLSAITLSGDPAFTRDGGTCTSTTALAAGESCSVVVRLTPTAAGEKAGRLEVASNDAKSPLVVALSATVRAATTPDPTTPDPTTPTPGGKADVLAKLKGKNNGPARDRVKVVTKPQANGARVKLFTRTNGQKVLLKTATLNGSGKKVFIRPDANGDALTKYWVVVRGTDDTRRARSNTKKIR